MKERKAENRPVVRPGAVGWILEGAALLVLLADFSFTAWGTFALPEMPPEFFEFRGGGSMALLRAGLWVLPAVALLSYLLLTWLTSIPHRLPYPRPVTDDNRQRLYTTATRMLRVLKLLVVVLYAYASYNRIASAFGLPVMDVYTLYALALAVGKDRGRRRYALGRRTYERDAGSSASRISFICHRTFVSLPLVFRCSPASGFRFRKPGETIPSGAGLPYRANRVRSFSLSGRERVGFRAEPGVSVPSPGLRERGSLPLFQLATVCRTPFPGGTLSAGQGLCYGVSL